MPRSIADIIADFDALSAADFNPSAGGIHRLYELCNEMEAISDVEQCAPVLFRTIERLDEVDLGSPGPLVHTLESWKGAYERYLVISMRLKPTLQSVWMVNRILNTNPPDEITWLRLLQSVANHPHASEGARIAAQVFLDQREGM